jgi:hypothetical protein
LSPASLTSSNQLILLIGNYMNGTGIKGGAFGFRVSSINKASPFQGRLFLSAQEVFSW